MSTSTTPAGWWAGIFSPSVLAGVAEADLGVYLHVPFCEVRCGYCDFNTYTAAELGGGASQATFAATAIAELEWYARLLPPTPPVRSVFLGGGTPTLLPAADLVAMVAAVRRLFGLADDAEITTEANPDSVTPESLAMLREGGFTRVSFGMQSAVPHVLATLDRTHDPDRVSTAVAWARAAGFDEVSLDLIYGTPGESLEDWRTSLTAALAESPDHVSAYSLIVEEGTALARRVRRGELPMPDEDDLADKYELADDLLTAAGLGWYEVSNWARTTADQCQHNLAYWRSGNWLGIGPGAHGHLAGTRWWNVKHPRAYHDRVSDGGPWIQDAEHLTATQRTMERVLLQTRLVEGVAIDALPEPDRAAEVIADGLATDVAGRLVLTRRGRLLADAVVHRLLADVS